MESSFIDTLSALAVAMGGWKGLHLISEKLSSRAGNGGGGTRRAVENLEEKLLPHFQKQEDLLGRIHEDTEKLLETQQQTNVILSELKGRLAQTHRGGD